MMMERMNNVQAMKLTKQNVKSRIEIWNDPEPIKDGIEIWKNAKS